MSMLAWRLLGAGIAALAVVALAASSRVPVTLHAGDGALLRVGFSARPERIERCRTLSEAELAERPAHMRQRVECEGITASYRLEVRRDGVLLDTALVRGGGLRNDRQLYVFRELPVPAGSGTFEVRLARIEDDEDDEDEDGDVGDAHDDRERDDDDRDGDDRDGDAGASTGVPVTERERREVDERRRRVADEVPPTLELREVVTLAPREVMLVTYDPGTRRLRTERRPQ